MNTSQHYTQLTTIENECEHTWRTASPDLPALNNITDSEAAELLASSVFINDMPEKHKAVKVREQKCEKKNVDPITVDLVERKPHTEPVQRRCIEDVLFNLITRQRFRRTTREQIEKYREYFIGKIKSRIAAHAPLEFVLPSLPFKNSNPLVRQGRPGDTDLAEWLFFAQIRDFVEAVEHVYSPSCQFTILCDGKIFQDMFLPADKSDSASIYRANCMYIRNKLGLTKSVNLIDMQRLVSRQANFTTLRETFFQAIARLDTNNKQVKKCMDSLRRGMVFNLPFTDKGFQEVANMTKVSVDELPRDSYNRLTRVALRYASLHMALKRSRIIKQAFPHAIRATVHPKDAPQLPFNLLNNGSKVSPYNGIPVVSESHLEKSDDLRNSTHVVRRCQALKDPSLTACIDSENTATPVYYVGG